MNTSSKEISPKLDSIKAKTGTHLVLSSSLTRVIFNVRCYTNLDEDVSVVGSHPSLGEWDVKRAVKMVTDRTNYPIWFVNIDVPRGM